MKERLMGILNNMNGHDIWITHNQRTGFNGDELKNVKIIPPNKDEFDFIMEEKATEKRFDIDIRDIKDIDCEMSEDITIYLLNGINYNLEVIH